MVATDDDIVDELLTRRIVEIFLKHGFVLPAYVAITFTGNIILRPIREGHTPSTLSRFTI